MIRLHLLGYPCLSANGGGLVGAVSQRHRLALLTLVGLAPARTMARDRILALLWPDAATGDARHLLNTSVHVLRRAAGEGILITRHDEVTLSPDVATDIDDFERALSRGDYEQAVTCYRAPFMDGFYLDGASEFEQWASRERDRLRSAFRGTLQCLADGAERRGDINAAIRWWRRLTHEDPFSTRAVMRLMLALERAGDPGNALELALEHQSLLARELEATPAPEFRELALRMRSAPNGVHESALTLTTAGPARAVEPPPSSISTKPADAPLLSLKAQRLATRAAIGAIAAVLAGVGVWMAFAFEPGDYVGGRVLVIPFDNATGDSSLRPLSRVVSTWITDGLTRTGALDVTTGVGAASLAAPANPLAEAKAASASFVVTGSVHLHGTDSIRFQSIVTETTSGRVVSSLPSVKGLRRDPMPAVEEVRSRLSGALAALVDERIGRAAATIAPPMYAAYVEYVAGLDQVQTGHLAQFRFLEAARIDTSFTLALIWAAYALDRCENARARGFPSRCLTASWESLMGVAESRRAGLSPLERHALDFTKARRTKDHRLYYESAKAAAQLVPVSFWTAHAFLSATDLGRNGEAMATLVAMRDVPMFERVFPAYRAHLRTRFHEEGWFEDEMAEARRVERSPGPLNPPLQILAAKATAAAALGLTDSVFQVAGAMANMRSGVLSIAGAAQELRAHGNPAAADSMAQLCTSLVEASADTTPSGLLAAASCAKSRRDFAEARRLYETCCIGANYTQVRLLSELGAFAALEGDTAGANRYSATIDTLPIAKASDTRWFASQFAAEKLSGQATIAAAMGDGPKAVKLLQLSFNEWGGLRLRFRHTQLSPEYDPIRSFPPFQRLVASLPRPLPRPRPGSP